MSREIVREYNKIVAGAQFTGDIVSEGDLRLDGTLHGNLTIKGKLVLGETGSLEGKISCKSCDISGVLRGEVHCEDVMILRTTSKVEALLEVAKLVIESGAIFNGECKMNENENIGL